MKNDSYLKYATYPSYSVISSGTKIVNTPATVMRNSVGSSYLGKVKCRNDAKNSSGTCSSGQNYKDTKSNGKDSVTCSNSTNSHENHGNGCYDLCHFLYQYNNSKTFFTKGNGYNAFTSDSNGAKDYGTCNNSTNSHNTHQNGTCTSSTCYQGTNTNGTVVDILCANTTKSNA